MVFDWFGFLNTKDRQKELLDNLTLEVSYWIGKYKESERLRNNEWLNPYNWDVVNIKWNTISGLDIPPNTMITPTDKTIKQVVMKLKGKDIKESADNVKKWINQNISYCYDEKNDFHPHYIEWYQPASFTFSCRKGDCEDMSILFQTMMHQLGYGDKSVCAVANNAEHLVKWFNGDYFGHCYNLVLIGKEWVVYDANSGDMQSKCVYPDNKYVAYVFNLWGMYKLT